jgi:hypothetical protein
MKHQAIHDSLLEFGAPKKLIHAVLQELSESKFLVSYQGLQWSWPDFKFQKGGRQGGTETPYLWTVLLDVAMQRARKRWREAGLGFFLKDDAMDLQGFLDCLIFADDMVLGADSIGDLFAMLNIIVEELEVFGLRVKPGSLELLPVGISLPDKEYKVAGLDIKVKESMSVLGVMIDGSGSDGAAIEHRLSQGWAHFFEREKAFTCRRVPLRLRWKRFSQTVF